jgi:hypothetical protein
MQNLDLGSINFTWSKLADLVENLYPKYHHVEEFLILSIDSIAIAIYN